MNVCVDRPEIKVKKYTFNNNTYTILNYDKELHIDDETGKYRSLIVSDTDNKLLSISPPKCIPIDIFMKKYPTLENVYIDDIIEGTMINVWYDERISSWEISTKSAVGGNYSYFRNNVNDDGSVGKTFRQMFFDALGNFDLFKILSSLPVYSEFSYSFVLQHQENHIVYKIDVPKLYLVGVYQFVIKENEYGLTDIITIPQEQFQYWGIFQNTSIVFSPRLLDVTYKSLLETFTSIQSENYPVGVMFTHMETGERSKIVNNVYLKSKNIRGNNPNLFYQYLCLNRIGKVDEFLVLFPWYNTIFDIFKTQQNEYVINLYKSYKSRYILRTGEIINKTYMPHIYRIHHEIYLTSIHSGKRTGITLEIVREYWNNQLSMFQS
jgi:hypothetical protein